MLLKIKCISVFFLIISIMGFFGFWKNCFGDKIGNKIMPGITFLIYTVLLLYLILN